MVFQEASAFSEGMHSLPAVLDKPALYPSWDFDRDTWMHACAILSFKTKIPNNWLNLSSPPPPLSQVNL